MRFLADSTLGRLARWLRLLGYDAADYTGIIDRHFLNQAWREERIALSRKRNMQKRDFRGTLIIIEEDLVRDQIAALVRRLSLHVEPENLFTFCLECNERLTLVAKEKIQNQVPEYVFSTQEIFKICPKCDKIYWQGTHRERAMALLGKILDTPLKKDNA